MSDVRKMAEEMRRALLHPPGFSQPSGAVRAEYRTADKICEYLDGWASSTAGERRTPGSWPWCGASAQERRWGSVRTWTPCP